MLLLGCWIAQLQGQRSERGRIPVPSDVRGAPWSCAAQYCGSVGCEGMEYTMGFWEGRILKTEMARQELRGVGNSTREERFISSKEGRVGE